MGRIIEIMLSSDKFICGNNSYLNIIMNKVWRTVDNILFSYVIINMIHHFLHKQQFLESDRLILLYVVFG